MYEMVSSGVYNHVLNFIYKYAYFCAISSGREGAGVDPFKSKLFIGHSV